MRSSSGTSGTATTRPTMITTFQSTGTKAVAPNSPWACSTAATRPVRPSSTTIGNMIWASWTVSSTSSSDRPGANRGITQGAVTIAISVTRPRTMLMRPISPPTRRWASLWRPCSSSSVKIGMKAADRAESATRLRSRFGTWNAITKALIEPRVPKRAAARISRARPAMRLTPVQTAKIAVERPSPRAGDARRRAAPWTGAGRLTAGPGPGRSLPYAADRPTEDRPRGEHQAAEEAEPPSPGAARAEPSLPLDDQDPLPQARRRGRGRRRGRDRGAGARARAPDRPRRRRGRDSPQQRGPQEAQGRARVPEGEGRHHGLAFSARRRPPAARQGEQVPRRRLQDQALPVVPRAPQLAQGADPQVQLQLGQPRHGPPGRPRRHRAGLLGELAGRVAGRAGRLGHRLGRDAVAERLGLGEAAEVVRQLHLHHDRGDRVVAGGQVLEHVVGARRVARHERVGQLVGL